MTLESVGTQVRCPASMVSHVKSILDGEYDVPWLTFAEPPRVLDIGANVGAFAVWASRRWPRCHLTCFEPNPEALALLRHNIFETWPRPQVYGVAITTQKDALLRPGLNNLGEASLFDLGEQAVGGVVVPTWHPRDLPNCDVLKLDTEGSELDIILHYAGSPTMIALEYHRAFDRRQIESLLCPLYTLVRGRITRADRGTMVYVKSEVT